MSKIKFYINQRMLKIVFDLFGQAVRCEWHGKSVESEMGAVAKKEKWKAKI